MAAIVVEPVSSSKDALPACLWPENPYRLISLLDLMKPFKPRRGSALAAAKTCIIECRAVCEKYGLGVSALKAKSALEIFDLSPSRVDPDYLDRASLIIVETMCEEMSLRKYFEVSPEKAASFVEGQHPFGDQVEDKFPSTKYDAAEAGRCYALGRNTACVFHLMRVLELGLAALAKQFNVPSDHANWDQIIGRIEKAIQEIEKDPNKPSNWRDEREFYSQCVSHFRIVKDAWRNYTAHARGKYDEQEALDIFGNVRGFMQKLSTRLQE